MASSAARDGTAATALPNVRAVSSGTLIGYGVTIASFLGAIHWGLVMRDAPNPSPALLGWGVVPGLIAWMAPLPSPVPALFALTGLLWACFAVDRAVYPKYEIQGWLPLRWNLTLVASVSCGAGAVGMMR